MPSALGRQIGQLLIAGFDGDTLPVETRALARDFGLGGIILFARNVKEPAQVAELAFEAAGLSPEMPLWVSVDQEGGRVARLKAPFTEWPPMATLGRAGDPALARRFATALAAELRAVGVTLDFAPVLDVHTNPKNPVIGDRALAERADLVATLGGELIAGLQDAGVAACGKHFPGHGDTSTDSHLELPLVEHPIERLREVEFVPFREAVRREVATIMTAHVHMPALDEGVPATFSRRIVTGLLREELGYQGVILSDDLEMKAVAASTPVPEGAVRALLAGCDGVLICSGKYDLQAQALEALVKAVESGRLPLKWVEDALLRQRRAKERFLAASPARPAAGRTLREQLGRDEARRVADEMARFL